MQYVATCKHELFSAFICIFLYFVYFLMCSNNSLLWKTCLISGLCYYFLRRLGNSHFVVLFWRIGFVLFLLKGGKDAVHGGRNGRRGVFSRQSRHFPFVDNMIKVLFSFCTLIWRVNNYVSRRAKSINRRNRSTTIFIKICSLRVLYSFVEIYNCLSSLKLFPHNKRRLALLL